jgi:peroxiredoxin Q/BCP
MFRFIIAGLIFSHGAFSSAAELKIKEAAPLFKAQTQDNKEFDLNSRKGKWTVLYFYPKAGTPGCTKQACAFRDNIDKIHAQGAEVYGISADTVADQAKFYKEHHLNFDLLADPDDHVVELYGTKMPVMKYSKRWTFIIDPDLKIRAVMKDVDPVIDSEKMASTLQTLKNQK